MKRPYKFTIICDKTGEIVSQQNYEPLLHHLQTWEPTGEHGVSQLMQTKTAYIDTRYEAKMRLFNYINYHKKGLEAPKYRPFEGTEIGKSIPILNF